MSIRGLAALFASVVLSGWLAVPSFADSQARIVRLSQVEGDVQIDRNTGQGYEKAFLNLPMTQGTKLRTGQDARAEIEFENGSRIVLGHFYDDSDIDNYLGIEYDGIAVEEATQLSEKKYTEIQTCRRTSHPNWRPRTYTTTNPGGVGHYWYKAKFIQPWREDRQTSTRFIFATYRDNKFLNHDYVHILNDLKGWQLSAWRDGEWVGCQSLTALPIRKIVNAIGRVAKPRQASF